MSLAEERSGPEIGVGNPGVADAGAPLRPLQSNVPRKACQAGRHSEPTTPGSDDPETGLNLCEALPLLAELVLPVP